MPDLSVVPTVISTIGALLGALGGVALTNRISARREEAQFRREEAQFNRQRKDQQTEALRQAHHDLLGTAAQLRTEVEFAGLRYWNDMNVKLATIQQHAVTAGLYASRVAVLSPHTADAARELASAASRLAATTARYTTMGGNQNQPLVGGQISQPIDLAEFDAHFERLSRAAAEDGQG
jgi:hypothetical protein